MIPSTLPPSSWITSVRCHSPKGHIVEWSLGLYWVSQNFVWMFHNTLWKTQMNFLAKPIFLSPLEGVSKIAVCYINSVHVGHGQDGSVCIKHVCYPCSHVFPGDSLGKESACNVGDHVRFWLRRVDPLQKEMTTYSNILAWKFHDRGNWWDTVHEAARVRHDLPTKLPSLAQSFIHILFFWTLQLCLQVFFFF